MGFGIAHDRLERERHRLVVFFETQAQAAGVESGRVDWPAKDMNLCARLWDGRRSDRWIFIDLRQGEELQGFIKTTDFDDQVVGLLCLFFPPDRLSLELAWSFQHAWLYDRIDPAEMQLRLEALPPAL